MPKPPNFGKGIESQDPISTDDLRNRYFTHNYATFYSYDPHGNVKTLVHDIPELTCASDEITDYTSNGHRYKKLDYRYDLISGNVKQVIYQNNQRDMFTHWYK